MFPSPEPPTKPVSKRAWAGGWRLPSKTVMYLQSVSQIWWRSPESNEEEKLMRKLFNHVSTQSEVAFVLREEPFSRPPFRCEV